MTLEFAAAKPIKSKNTGKVPEDNPFTDVIREIALKTDEDGPVARSFRVSIADPDERQKELERLSRRMHTAANNNDPACTGRKDISPVKVNAGKANEKDHPTDVVFTFWTVPHQTRPRKAAATPAVENVPDATPAA